MIHSYKAQIINNGMDSYAVIKLSRETTQEELKTVIEQIIEAKSKINNIEEKVNSIPKIISGTEPPDNSIGNDGDIYLWY